MPQKITSQPLVVGTPVVLGIPGTGALAGIKPLASPDNAVLVQLQQKATTTTFFLEGTPDGGQTWDNLPGLLTDDFLTWNSNGSGGITYAGVNRAWVVPFFGHNAVRIREVSQTGTPVNLVTMSSDFFPWSMLFPGSGLSSAVYTGRLTAQLYNNSPIPVDTYGATMTLDTTKGLHIINVSSTTSATSTWSPTVVGQAGDELQIITEADASGTVTVTFSGAFHSSGTQATTASHESVINFVSDGTKWLEVSRTTAIA